MSDAERLAAFEGGSRRTRLVIANMCFGWIEGC
jgi:hypothetical protein